MCARPCGAKSQTVLNLIDAQVYTEEAIQSLRMRDVERAIRCMELARQAQRQASAGIEGVNRWTNRQETH